MAASKPIETDAARENRSKFLSSKPDFSCTTTPDEGSLRSTALPLLAILLLAAVLRLGMLPLWERRAEGGFFFGDSQTYWDLGRHIAEGKPYAFGRAGEFRTFRMPGYPVLLAPLFLVFGEQPPLLAARLLSVAFGVATVGAAGILALRAFPEKRRFALPVALLVALYVAVDPLQIATSVFVLSEAPFGFFLLLQIGLWIGLLRQLNAASSFPTATMFPFPWCRAVLLGLVTAVCVYLRPSWLLFLPFALAVHVLGCAMHALFLGNHVENQDENRMENLAGNRNVNRAANPFALTRNTLAAYGLVVLVFLLGMSPWWLRNYRVNGRFVATTLQTGASLYDGLREDADGSSDMRFVDAFRASEPLGSPTYEYDVDEKMKRAAVDWARAHPGRVLRLALVKFGRMWNPRPNEPSFSQPAVATIVVLSYLPLLLAAPVGIVLTWRRGMETWLLWLPALYLTGLHVVFVASLRYRIPATPLLAVFAAYVLVRLVHNVRSLSDT